MVPIVFLSGVSIEDSNIFRCFLRKTFLVLSNISDTLQYFAMLSHVPWYSSIPSDTLWWSPILADALWLPESGALQYWPMFFAGLQYSPKFSGTLQCSPIFFLVLSDDHRQLLPNEIHLASLITSIWDLGNHYSVMDSKIRSQGSLGT